MEENLLLQQTKPVLNTVLDIVMLNAHKTLSSSMERPMFSDGTHPQVTQMPEKANGDPAVLRWISGKPTLFQVPTLLILVTMMVFGDARTKPIAETLIDMVEFAIKMVAILMLSDLESPISSDQDHNSKSTLPSQ